MHQKKNNDGLLFELFWENTKLNDQLIDKFILGLDADSRKIHPTPQLYYPKDDLILSKPTDRLAHLMQERKSVREFSNKPLSEKQLGSLFQSFSQISSSRMIPSAGGKYPIETFAYLLNVKSPLNGSVVYHNADNNSLSLVCDSPKWQDLASWIGSELSGMPAVVFVFVAFPLRTIQKYGDRGGRFILLEAGHYAQNLGLRLAYERLGGVELGGMYDDDIKESLGLKDTSALVTLGYAVGHNLK